MPVGTSPRSRRQRSSYRCAAVLLAFAVITLATPIAPAHADNGQEYGATLRGAIAQGGSVACELAQVANAFAFASDAIGGISALIQGGTAKGGPAEKAISKALDL